MELKEMFDAVTLRAALIVLLVLQTLFMLLIIAGFHIIRSAIIYVIAKNSLQSQELLDTINGINVSMRMLKALLLLTVLLLTGLIAIFTLLKNY